MKKTAKKEQIKYKVVSNAKNFETKILNLPFSFIISSFIHSFRCCSLAHHIMRRNTATRHITHYHVIPDHSTPYHENEHRSTSYHTFPRHTTPEHTVSSKGHHSTSLHTLPCHTAPHHTSTFSSYHAKPLFTNSHYDKWSTTHDATQDFPVGNCPSLVLRWILKLWFFTS